MTDEPDFAIAVHHRTLSKEHRTASQPHSEAVADILAYRLVELQCSPIRGGFDGGHLQNVHHYVCQDIYDRAGELRVSDVDGLAAEELEQSLDKILDRLASEDYLRGLEPDEWAPRAAGYVGEIESLHPFDLGDGVAIREFALELARKNQLNLQWDQAAERSATETLALLQQTEQAANFRRVIMLAMDIEPRATRPTRGKDIENTIDRVPYGAMF